MFQNEKVCLVKRNDCIRLKGELIRERTRCFMEYDGHIKHNLFLEEGGFLCIQYEDMKQHEDQRIIESLYSSN